MDERTFERKLFAWIDGELPRAEAVEMELWCLTRPEARARVDAERAADARIRAALLADPAARESVEKALAASRPVATAATPRTGRVLRLPRWLPVSAAAAVLVAFGMWFACVPPFECGVVLAIEKAAEVAEAAECTDGEGCPLTARMRAAAGSLGAEMGNPARVPVECCPGCTGTAYKFRWKGADLMCVWSPCLACDPSFRRSRDLGGTHGWAANGNGKSFAAFRDPTTGLLCSLVGTCPEDTVTSLATDLWAALQ